MRATNQATPKKVAKRVSIAGRFMPLGYLGSALSLVRTFFKDDAPGVVPVKFPNRYRLPTIYGDDTLLCKPRQIRMYSGDWGDPTTPSLLP